MKNVNRSARGGVFNRITAGKRIGLLSLIILFLCTVFLGCVFSVFSASGKQLRVAVSAAGGDGSEVHPYIMTTVSDWKTAVDRASTEDNPTYVRLGANITASGGAFAITGVTSATTASIYIGALNVPAGKYIVLDLQNYVINRGLTSGTANGHVITVYGSLTIEGETDKDTTLSGGITGGYSNSGYGGAGIFIAAGGTCTMNGGSIYGNTTTVNANGTGGGGGVSVQGTFTLNEGNIHDNKAISGTTIDGGGVQVGGNGYFEMNGGAIYNNATYQSGGGVDVFSIDQSEKPTFVMNGGEIYANTASTNYPLAVGAYGYGVVIINGGYIHDHVSSVAGSGVLGVGTGTGTIQLNGGVFSNNKTAYGLICSAGDQYLRTTFSGPVQVFDNYNSAGTVQLNVYLTSSYVIKVSGNLLGAHIGVTYNNATSSGAKTSFTSGYSTYNAGIDASQYFFSDKSTYHVAMGTTEANLVSGAVTLSKLVWKYQYAGETTWNLVSTAASTDAKVTLGYGSYLEFKDPTKAVIVAPFVSETATTPLVPMTDLIRSTSYDSTNTTFTSCTGKLLNFEDGSFNFRYNGTDYANASFSLRFTFTKDSTITFYDLVYSGSMQLAINGKTLYVDSITFLTKPSYAAQPVIDGTAVEVLDAGVYTFKLELTDYYIELLDAEIMVLPDEVEKNTSGEYIATVTVERAKIEISDKASTTYTSEKLWFDDCTDSWVSKELANTAIVSPNSVSYKNFASGATYAVLSEGKDGVQSAGYYEIRLVLTDAAKNNYTWSDGTQTTKTVELTVKKAPLEMNAPVVDEYGELAAGESITYKSGILGSDYSVMSQAGVFGLEYVAKADLAGGVWTRTTPTNAGEYYVRPYIVNPDSCNYEIDYTVNCQTLFERMKNSVAVPFLYLDNATVDSTTHTTSIPYTGAAQILDLVNTKADDGTYFLSDGIKVTATDGLAMVGANAYSATNMRTYTLTVDLTDPDNTRWATGEKDNTNPQTVTLIITEAYLFVTHVFEDDSVLVSDSTFTKEEHGTIVLSAGQILSIVSSSQSQVTLDVSYTGAANGVVADTDMFIEGDYVKANIDILTLPIGTYTFTVRLRDGISANTNYTLATKDRDGLVTVVEEYTFKFTILAAEINIQNVAWQYQNFRTNNNIAVRVEDGDSLQFFYNGYVFDFTYAAIIKDNGSAVANTAGLIFDYTVTSSNGITVGKNGVEQNGGYKNAGKYTTTLKITINPDISGYTLSTSSKTTFTIEWEILPVDFDLNDIAFEAGFVYDSTRHYLTVSNPQISALCEELGGTYVNDAISAGDYHGGFIIFADDEGNISFTCSATDTVVQDGYTWFVTQYNALVRIDDATGYAYALYDWSIAKKTLNVSNASSSWVENVLTDAYGSQFVSYLPKIFDEYSSILDIRYYSDSNLTQEIDVNSLVVQYGLETVPTYYVRVSIQDAYTKNYELKNGTLDYAYKSFKVGSTLKGIDVTATVNGANVVKDSTNEFAAVVNDKGYTLVASADGYPTSAFAVTYYSKNTEGDWEVMSGIPTEIGDYKMTVSFKNANDEFEIRNPDFFLTIYEEDDPDMPEITDSDTTGVGDLSDPDDPNNPNNPDEDDKSGGGWNPFDALPDGFPLWQTITICICIIFLIIFSILWGKYRRERKKTYKKINEYKAMSVGAPALLAIFTVPFLGLDYTIWTYIAIGVIALTVFTCVGMLVARARAKKAKAELEDLENHPELRNAKEEKQARLEREEEKRRREEERAEEKRRREEEREEEKRRREEEREEEKRRREEEREEEKRRREEEHEARIAAMGMNAAQMGMNGAVGVNGVAAQPVVGMNGTAQPAQPVVVQGQPAQPIVVQGQPAQPVVVQGQPAQAQPIVVNSGSTDQINELRNDLKQEIRDLRHEMKNQSAQPAQPAPQPVAARGAQPAQAPLVGVNGAVGIPAQPVVMGQPMVGASGVPAQPVVVQGQPAQPQIVIKGQVQSGSDADRILNEIKDEIGHQARVERLLETIAISREQDRQKIAQEEQERNERMHNLELRRKERMEAMEFHHAPYDPSAERVRELEGKLHNMEEMMWMMRFGGMQQVQQPQIASAKDETIQELKKELREMKEKHEAQLASAKDERLQELENELREMKFMQQQAQIISELKEQQNKLASEKDEKVHELEAKLREMELKQQEQLRREEEEKRFRDWESRMDAKLGIAPQAPVSTQSESPAPKTAGGKEQPVVVVQQPATQPMHHSTVQPGSVMTTTTTTTIDATKDAKADDLTENTSRFIARRRT